MSPPRDAAHAGFNDPALSALIWLSFGWYRQSVIPWPLIDQLAAGPHADLVAVRVLRDPELVLRREQGDADELVRVVARVVRAVGPGGETHGVAGVERALTLGRAKCGPPGEHDQPLLVGPFEV